MIFQILQLARKLTKKKAIGISKAMQSIQKYAQESLVKLQISQSNQAKKYRKKIFYDIRNKV